MDFRGTKYNRGIRNNNPGNIVKSNTAWQGKVALNKNTDSRFEQFVSMQYGIRALMKNVITWVNRGENTIEKLIKKWAPEFENNTAGYIQRVSSEVGVGPREVLKLDKNQMISLAKAVVKVENAPDHKYIPDKLYTEAFNLLGAYEVKKKPLP